MSAKFPRGGGSRTFFSSKSSNQAQVLLKRSCTFGKLENTQSKEITLLCMGKNNICISCVLMALSILFLILKNVKDSSYS